jgi:hypothetical protein
MPNNNARKDPLYQFASTWIIRLAKVKNWFLYNVTSKSDHHAQSNPETISLKNDRVTFTLPAEFTQMSAEEIDLKFPRGGNRPDRVYANPARSVSIAVTFSPAQVTPQELPELKISLRQFLGKVFPSAEWKREEIISINNTPWIHLEFVTQAIDTQVNNDTYFTSFDGRMLGFNFNSTVKQYQFNRVALEKTRDSIRIRSKSTSPRTRLTRPKPPLQRSLKQLRLNLLINTLRRNLKS